MHLKLRDQRLKTIIGRQIDRTHGNHKPKICNKYTERERETDRQTHRDREKGIQRKKRKLASLSCIQLLGIPQIVACPATLSTEFSRQEHWRGLSFPSPGALPYPGIKPGSPAYRQILYQLSWQGSQRNTNITLKIVINSQGKGTKEEKRSKKEPIETSPKQ